GFVRRYLPEAAADGVGGPEGVFLPCSFWLVDNYVLSGRLDDAQALFDRLADLANDVGLLSEEYDPIAGRMLGNFPQAFSHVGLINTALNLARRMGPAEDRAETPKKGGAQRCARPPAPVQDKKSLPRRSAPTQTGRPGRNQRTIGHAAP